MAPEEKTQLEKYLHYRHVMILLKASARRVLNPRTQQWRDHFVLDSARIAGLTSTGQATIDLPHLNDDARLLEREVMIAESRYPR
ncbi:MAG: hypothetical protein ACREEM_11470 [Blastocatellia bacterium]